MITIRPLRGLRPPRELVAKVAAPPYDVISSEEAALMAQGNPLSFLHINKPEIDLPEKTHLYSDVVYEKGRDNLQRFIQQGVMRRDSQEAIYVYRLTWRGRSQTGYFCLSSVDDYLQGRIKKHELTRADKEADRTRLTDVQNAQIGPVFLFYPSHPHLDEILAQTCRTPAEVDFVSPDKVVNQLWLITDPEQIALIQSLFNALPATYVADGHHRSASACNVCQLRRQRNPNYTGKEPFNYFLSVIFPHDQLQILPYNRVVKDLNGASDESFLRKVESIFTVTPAPGQFVADRPHQMGMYLCGQWHQLVARPGTFTADDPLDNLDVNILMKQLLSPVLNISDPRTDKRIDFIGGIRGNEELVRLVDSGKFKVAFSLYPTTMHQLMHVADSGLIMPPKSTWFEPKLKSGLVVHLLD
jgi:uncharacterized protein (DUF1015 family)